MNTRIFVLIAFAAITFSPSLGYAFQCKTTTSKGGTTSSDVTCQPANPNCRYASAHITMSGSGTANPTVTCTPKPTTPTYPQECFNKAYYSSGSGVKAIDCNQDLGSQIGSSAASSLLGGGSGSLAGAMGQGLMSGLGSALGQMAGQMIMGLFNKQSSPSGGGGMPVQTTLGGGTVNTATTDTVLDSLKKDNSVSDINEGAIADKASNYDSLLDKFFDNNPPEVKEAATKGSADTSASNTEEGDTETPSAEDATTARPAGIGSVRADESGAIITVDVSGDKKSGIVGFFGSVKTGFKQTTTPIGKLCSARPWAGSLVSKVIPETFFDGLCKRFGYTPGAPLSESDVAPIDVSGQERVVLSADLIRKAKPSAPTRGITCEPGIIDLGGNAKIKWSCGRSQLAQVANFTPTENGDPSVVSPRTTTTYGIACDDKVTAQCTVQVVNPRLTIWSEPKEVTLGTRATIFWNAQDVTGCTVDGPSFHEIGVQGGASTVPITEATTFTMQCQSISGATTTKDLIVDLAL